MQTGSMNIHNHDTITVSSTWRQCGAQKKSRTFSAADSMHVFILFIVRPCGM